MKRNVKVVVFEDGFMKYRAAIRPPIPFEDDHFRFDWHDRWNAHGDRAAAAAGISKSQQINSETTFAEALVFARSGLSGEALVFVDLELISPDEGLLAVSEGQLTGDDFDWAAALGPNWRELIAARQGLLLAHAALANSGWIGDLYFASSAHTINEDEYPGLYQRLRQLNHRGGRPLDRRVFWLEHRSA